MNKGWPISFCAPEEAQRATILADMLQLSLNWLPAPTGNTIAPLTAEMATLCIDGGKKAKMRPGDVLGALTGDMGFDGADIGKYRPPGPRLCGDPPEYGAEGV
ncbi:DbpA RNA binding domain-containing protein [Klebsiella pneumoniae]|nr:DbpA RNA binding domain-containing protein [Klebsiella pneumoniae]